MAEQGEFTRAMGSAILPRVVLGMTTTETAHGAGVPSDMSRGKLRPLGLLLPAGPFLAEATRDVLLAELLGETAELEL